MLSRIILLIWSLSDDPSEINGWDYVVECYGDEEIAVILNEEAAVTVSKAIKAVGKVAKHYDDLRKEIQATAF